MSRINRRARDAEGRTIAPMTLGNMRALNVDRVTLCCVETGCGWSKSVGLSEWPDDVAVPDVGLRVPCPRCGAPETDSRPDWPKRQVATHAP